MLTELEQRVLSSSFGTVGPFSAFAADAKSSEYLSSVNSDTDSQLSIVEAEIPFINDDIEYEVSSNCLPEAKGVARCSDEFRHAQTAKQYIAKPSIYTRIDEGVIVRPGSLGQNFHVDNDYTELIHHYFHAVTDLLQPAQHTRNPYKSIYFPRAITASAVGMHAESSFSSSALFHALLSVSAFHLHRITAGEVHYEKIGRLHRLKAVKYLQEALNDDSADEYTTMSAMLSLVSTDLMEGGMTEFWIHLEGSQRLQSSVIAKETWDFEHKQLHTICSFMATLARSTDPNLEPIPWKEDKSSIKNSPFQIDDHSLEFTYGTTGRLASFLHVTIKLTQHLAFYRSKNLSLPASLLQVCSNLATLISAWSIADESLASVPDRDYETLALVKCYVTAFHAATAIYFHTLVQPCSSSLLRSYAKTAVENLLCAEALKSVPASKWTLMAPIVWPGFIAACEAVPEDRPLWTTWWVMVQKYCIGSIAALWVVVQEVWRARDNNRLENPRWLSVLKRKGKRVMSGG